MINIFMVIKLIRYDVFTNYINICSGWQAQIGEQYGWLVKWLSRVPANLRTAVTSRAAHVEDLYASALHKGEKETELLPNTSTWIKESH